MVKKCINIEKLKKDIISLYQLIEILQTKHGLSLRKIAEILGIGRETIRKVVNKNRPH